MTTMNLTAKVLDKFVETAKAAEAANQPVVDAITGGIRANPSMTRQEILALATRAVEGANGTTP